MAKRPRRSEGPKSSSSLAFASDKKATKGKIDDDAIEKRKAECRGTLEALNNQFYAHVAEQKRKNPIKSWAEGCQDYVKHLRKLMSDFKDVFEEENEHDNDDEGEKTNSDDSDDDGEPKTSIFGNLPKPTAFGTGASNPFGAPGGGGGGGASSLFPPAGGAKSASNPFGGTSAAFPKFPAGGTIAQQAKEEEDDEEPERPPSPSTAEATGEDDKEFVDMEKQKVKLYVKKEASEPWADRGVNRLQFRREKGDAKGACRILMRTSIGKAVVNANLYDNMSVTFAEQKDKKDGSMKKTGVILTIFNACENSEKQIVLLKLGSQEAVEELHGLIVKNTKK